MLRLALLSTVLLAACTDAGGEGILITMNVAPGDGCTFSGIDTESFLPAGTLQIGGEYYAFPQLRSRITADAGSEAQRTIIVQEADIDLAFQDTALFTADQLQAMHDTGVTHFKSTFTVPLAPNGGIADGAFVLIPIGVSDAINAADPEFATATELRATQIDATFKVRGEMQGSKVTSNDFAFGVRVVNHGLFRYVGTCPPSGTVSVGNPCNAGQDFVTDCCGESSSAPQTCPAQ